MFLYHSGLSYREVELFIDRYYLAVYSWYKKIGSLFESGSSSCEVVTDETKLKIDGRQVYIVR